MPSRSFEGGRLNPAKTFGYFCGLGRTLPLDGHSVFEPTNEFVRSVLLDGRHATDEALTEQ